MSTKSFRLSITLILPAAILLAISLPQSSQAQTATITTVAGNGSAVKNMPEGITATAAQITAPIDLDIDSQGNVYFIYSDDPASQKGTPDVYRVSTSGVLTRAFQIPGGSSSSWAEGVTVTSAGDAAYVTDFNNNSGQVSRLTSAGQTVVAGGPYSFSQFYFPLGGFAGIRYHSGILYLTDSGNNRAVQISSNNTVTTIANLFDFQGYSGDGGSATNAHLNTPQAIAIDSAGNVFVADTFNHCVRKISTAGVITSFAGNCGVQGFSGDGGTALAAHLSQPSGLAVSTSGAIYISDTGNNRIRRVNADGSIETVAGGGSTLGDNGPATAALLNKPRGLAFDPTGRLYIADSYNNRIRMLTFASGPSTPAANAPQISSNGIVSAASYATTVSQGSWAAIYGSNFSSKPARVWAAGDFSGTKLPTTLDGVSVTFNGIPAAIYYVSATQLDVQVPDGLPSGNVSVAVTTAAGTGIGTAVYASAAPALFTVGQLNSNGIAYAYPAAVHLDGTLVGRPNVIAGSRPASMGETIEIFGTGYGPSDPPVPSGYYLFPPSPLDSIITVTMPSGRTVPTAAYLISPGLYQFNVTVPYGLQSGYDSQIQIGFLAGAQSQGTVYLPVN